MEVAHWFNEPRSPLHLLACTLYYIISFILYSQRGKNANTKNNYKKLMNYTYVEEYKQDVIHYYKNIIPLQSLKDWQ